MNAAVSAHAAPPVNRVITSRRLKAGLFAIEGLNSLSTTYFFYYLYFYMQEKHHFGALQNLMLAAALGFVYMLTAVLSGRFAQRFGYLVALRWGIIAMIASFSLATQVSGAIPILALALVGNIGMCFTWPALEALVSEGEPPRRLQNLLGIYNIVWAVTSAFAYFTGGAMVERFGWAGMFAVPAGLQLIELGIVLWIESRVHRQSASTCVTTADFEPMPHEVIPPKVSPKAFLKMALLANPLAYLAINTVIAVVPTLAAGLKLDKATTGFVCSAWLFVRAGAFVLLWLWPKWHYRFRFLISSYAALVGSFAVMLLTPNVPVLILAEVFFGFAVGLIYYSSLFYSMDVGETKGEHGGIHEGAIGAGCCLGPATAAFGLQFASINPASGTAAVTALLLCGLGGLVWLRTKG